MDGLIHDGAIALVFEADELTLLPLSHDWVPLQFALVELALQRCECQGEGIAPLVSEEIPALADIHKHPVGVKNLGRSLIERLLHASGSNGESCGIPHLHHLHGGRVRIEGAGFGCTASTAAVVSGRHSR